MRIVMPVLGGAIVGIFVGAVIGVIASISLLLMIPLSVVGIAALMVHRRRQ